MMTAPNSNSPSWPRLGSVDDAREMDSFFDNEEAFHSLSTGRSLFSPSPSSPATESFLFSNDSPSIDTPLASEDNQGRWASSPFATVHDAHWLSPLTQIDHPSWMEEPPAKKRRAAPVPLPKLLQSLQKSQLEQLVIDLASSHPDLETSIRQCLPDFDVLAALEELKMLNKKVYESLPHTRYTTTLDHACFLRTKPVQALFVAATKKTLTLLASSKQWKSLMEYLLGSVVEADDLPNWENASDLKPKLSLFKQFASSAKKVIQMNKEMTLSDNSRLLQLCSEFNRPLYGAPFAECLRLLSSDVPVTNAM